MAMNPSGRRKTLANMTIFLLVLLVSPMFLRVASAKEDDKKHDHDEKNDHKEEDDEDADDTESDADEDGDGGEEESDGEGDDGDGDDEEDEKGHAPPPTEEAAAEESKEEDVQSGAEEAPVETPVEVPAEIPAEVPAEIPAEVPPSEEPEQGAGAASGRGEAAEDIATPLAIFFKYRFRLKELGRDKKALYKQGQRLFEWASKARSRIADFKSRFDMREEYKPKAKKTSTKLRILLNDFANIAPKMAGIVNTPKAHKIAAVVEVIPRHFQEADEGVMSVTNDGCHRCERLRERWQNRVKSIVAEHIPI